MSADILSSHLSEKVQVARAVARRKHGSMIDALVAERALSKNIHWALYMLPLDQVTEEHIPGIIRALEQLPFLAGRYHLATELRSRREALLPQLKGDVCDQAPLRLREDMEYVFRVNPGLSDYLSGLIDYGKTLSRLEEWVEIHEH